MIVLNGSQPIFLVIGKSSLMGLSVWKLFYSLQHSSELVTPYGQLVDGFSC